MCPFSSSSELYHDTPLLLSPSGFDDKGDTLLLLMPSGFVERGDTLWLLPSGSVDKGDNSVLRCLIQSHFDHRHPSCMFSTTHFSLCQATMHSIFATVGLCQDTMHYLFDHVGLNQDTPPPTFDIDSLPSTFDITSISDDYSIVTQILHSLFSCHNCRCDAYFGYVAYAPSLSRLGIATGFFNTGIYRYNTGISHTGIKTGEAAKNRC